VRAPHQGSGSLSNWQQLIKQKLWQLATANKTKAVDRHSFGNRS
jgi:hypothetical protein